MFPVEQSVECQGADAGQLLRDDTDGLVQEVDDGLR